MSYLRELDSFIEGMRIVVSPDPLQWAAIESKLSALIDKEENLPQTSTPLSLKLKPRFRTKRLQR